MEYVWQKFEEEVRDFLNKKAKIDLDDVVLNKPVMLVQGNLSFPCFGMAKKMKKLPFKIAQDIADLFKTNKSDYKYIDKAEMLIGYVNFFVKKEIFYPELIKEILDCKNCYGGLEKKNLKIGVEYLSPNTNKPLTIGHARNGSLGNSLVNILKFAGYDVVSIVLYNDRGVHICKSMLAYQKWGENKIPQELGLKPDHMIGQFYVRFGKEAEKNEKLNDEVQIMLKKWEEGNEEVVELWKKMNDWFFEGVNKTLERVGISFNKKYLESEIYKFGKEIVNQALLDGKIYKLEDGAVEADLSDVNLDKKILLRKDGTTVYMVQDLFLAKKKIDDFQLDKSIYVVGNEQKYHFDVLFELLERFGIADKKKTYHLAYAMVNTASGRKMSSRLGEVEKWDDLLNDLHNLAKKEILNREEQISEEELERRSEIIAEAALKFELLNQDVNKTISFNKEEVVRFEGETGPYLLYTYARINSILDKAKSLGIKIDNNYQEFDNVAMDVLMSETACFYKQVELASECYNPSRISKYCYSLCQNINNFYHQYRVIEAETKSKQISRLLAFGAFKQVLKNCLTLLGIEVLEKM